MRKERAFKVSRNVAQSVATKNLSRMRVRGNPEVLDRTILGLSCAPLVSGATVLRIYELARNCRDLGICVASKFESLMELEALEFLLRGNQPIIWVRVSGIRGLKSEPQILSENVANGRITIVEGAIGLKCDPNHILLEVSDAVLACGINIVGISEQESVARTRKPVLALDQSKCRHQVAKICTQGLKSLLATNGSSYKGKDGAGDLDGPQN